MKFIKDVPAIFTILLLIASATVLSQTEPNPKSIAIDEFSGMLSFLSSDWMEGREAGAKGSFMASDYIASQMQTFGLVPYGDVKKVTPSNSEHGKIASTEKRSFFQTFDMIRYKTEKATLSLIHQSSSAKVEYQFDHSIDFTVYAGTQSKTVEAPLVFAGYGIHCPDGSWDDYQKLQTKDCIVVIMRGFPGHRDSTSTAYQKLSKANRKEYTGYQAKLKAAIDHGAIAIIEITADGSYNPLHYSQTNRKLVQSSMNTEKSTDPVYTDDDYMLAGDMDPQPIPFFRLGSEAAVKLFSETGFTPYEIEKKLDKKPGFYQRLFKEKKGMFSIEVKTEPLILRNVIGIIPGNDTTKSIIIGAHYDHLGKRGNDIYNGSDDNASGVAGMLALARLWKQKKEQPACNLLFAAWTAEEKGLLGSEYFVRKTYVNPDNTLLNINFDMISRSAPEDSTGLQLSIGTLKEGNELRKLATLKNLELQYPFELDLWEASEGGGSDYAFFASKKIPIMTYFSGYQENYHTVHDTSSKADLKKMAAILYLANSCLTEIIGNYGK